jgi:ribonuclease HI
LKFGGFSAEIDLDNPELFDDFFNRVYAVNLLARHNVAASRESHKLGFDRKHKLFDLKVGSLVKRVDFRQSNSLNQESRSLFPKWTGPWRIKERLNYNSLLLENVEDPSLTTRSHVSHVQPYRTLPDSEKTLPPVMVPPTPEPAAEQEETTTRTPSPTPPQRPRRTIQRPARYLDKIDVYDRVPRAKVKFDRIRDAARHFFVCDVNADKPFQMSEDGHVQIFVDGACTANATDHPVGSVGVIFNLQDSRNIAARIIPPAHNNLSEIYAVLLGLHAAKQFHLTKVEIMTDSNLLVQTLNKWLPVWKRNGFKTAKNKPVKNLEYIKLIDLVASEFDSVKFTHVKGHSTSQLNALSDSFAVFASNSYTPQSFVQEFFP